jgi:hypothetical protein
MDWSTGIVRIIPRLLHGYADIAVTVALVVLPFIVGFWDDTTALVFYLIVGAGRIGRDARDALRTAHACRQ